MALIMCYIFGLVLLLAKIKLMSQIGDSDAIRRIIIEILLLIFIIIFTFIALYFHGK